MAGDGPLAPPAIFHRGTTWPLGPDTVHRVKADCDRAGCTTRGWLLAYPGAMSDDRACVHAGCPAHRCLQA